MRDVYILGVSMTPFGRFFDKSVKDLTREAYLAVLDDAGMAEINASLHRMERYWGDQIRYIY